MWQALRTTNSLECSTRKTRRRSKTRASFATEESALTFPFGLLALGHIAPRRSDEYRHWKTLASRASAPAA